MAEGLNWQLVGEPVIGHLVTDLPGDGASPVHGDIAVAVVRPMSDPGARRATAAHELGHLVIGLEYSSGIH